MTTRVRCLYVQVSPIFPNVDYFSQNLINFGRKPHCILNLMNPGLRRQSEIYLQNAVHILIHF